MLISLNGTIMEEHQAVVSVLDHGFLYGIGLFETFRTYEGVPFLFEEHLDRLRHSCDELGMKYTPFKQELLTRIEQVLQANRLIDGYIRLTISAGTQPLGLPMGDYEQPNEIIYVKPLPEHRASKPVQLLQLRRNTPESIVRMKSSHYMNNILGSRELRSYPWATGAEGLFMNAEHQLVEGLTSNLFFVHRGLLCTPSVETGILPGITRAFILDLADQLDIPYEEGCYSQDLLIQAEDIFLTNSVQEMIPVSSVYDIEGNKVWHRGAAMKDPITHRLNESYQRATRGEVL